MKKMGKWQRGVRVYAHELLNFLKENNLEPTEENMLNGAKDWSHYSYGGNSLIYDGDIAERLATDSELKKTKGGEYQPNSRETWLDVQARALYQAHLIVKSFYWEFDRIVKDIENECVSQSDLAFISTHKDEVLEYDDIVLAEWAGITEEEWQKRWWAEKE